MRLNIDALQELYNTLTYGPVLTSPYAESPIDRAFKECDEKLSGSAAFAHIKDLENRCENLERSNKALRDDNDKLGDKAIELKKDIEELEKVKKRFKEGCMEKSKEIATLVSANADLSDRLAKLQRNYDRINRLWTSQIQENMELRSKITNMQREKKNYETIAKEREELLKEKDDIKRDNDAWQRRAKYAEKELDLAKRNKDGWRSRAMYAEKGYATLQKENTDLSGKIVDLKKKITELQKKGDDLTKKGEDLKKLINSVYGTTMNFRKDGMYELWNKLREFVDSTYSERLGCFLDVCSVEDLVEWDLEDFLEEYEKWLKKRIMPENPIFYFDNKPVIMGGTLEATVEVDKDLLAKVCGVKHKLDYGDAVRVPWRDYDYMYIGPEGKHIRLFDPKTHTVVVVSVKDNLTYQGCKIILCDEDDIRKIWKDKK